MYELLFHLKIFINTAYSTQLQQTYVSKQLNFAELKKNKTINNLITYLLEVHSKMYVISLQ